MALFTWFIVPWWLLIQQLLNFLRWVFFLETVVDDDSLKSKKFQAMTKLENSSSLAAMMTNIKKWYFFWVLEHHHHIHRYEIWKNRCRVREFFCQVRCHKFFSKRNSIHKTVVYGMEIWKNSSSLKKVGVSSHFTSRLLRLTWSLKKKENI